MRTMTTCQAASATRTRGADPGAPASGTAAAAQALFALRLPTGLQPSSPLWDFDLRCTADQAQCWFVVPLTVGRLALYRLPYAQPPADLGL